MKTFTFTSPPPRPWQCGPGEVHLWRVDLEHEGLELEQAFVDRVLSTEERERAARFHREIDRLHFRRGRAALRGILAGYLSCQPEELCFQYNAVGKPALAGPHGALAFNVAHSHGAALIVVTSKGCVGVDLERAMAPDDAIAVAERFFAPAEMAVLRGLLPERQSDAFIRGWLCKEAFLKALGQGFTVPPETIEVDVDPAHDPALLHLPETVGSAGEWCVRTFAVPPAHVAAVVCPAGPCVLRGWRWENSLPG